MCFQFIQSLYVIVFHKNWPSKRQIQKTIATLIGAFSIFYSHAATFSDTHNAQMANVLKEKVKALNLKFNRSHQERTLSTEAIQHISSQSPNSIREQSLQQIYYVIEKLNRIRQLNDLPAASAPLYLTSQPTQEDIYWALLRAIDESDLLLTNKPLKHFSRQANNAAKADSKDVFIATKEASDALDLSLTSSFITPTHVYQQAEYILDMVRFIRATQRLAPINYQQPHSVRKHNNHALSKAYALLSKIQNVQSGLGMPPIRNIPETPMRKITPTDVSNALKQVSNQLQRIQFHLGLSRHIHLKPLAGHRSANDILDVLNEALVTLPAFNGNDAFKQFDYTPKLPSIDDIYALNEHIIFGLDQYHSILGVRRLPATKITINTIDNSTLLHVVGSLFQQLNFLYQQENNLGVSAPEVALSDPSLKRLFAMLNRLDQELYIYYNPINSHYVPWLHSPTKQRFNGKTKQDIVAQLALIQSQLDALSGIKEAGEYFAIAQLNQINQLVSTPNAKQVNITQFVEDTLEQGTLTNTVLRIRLSQLYAKVRQAQHHDLYTAISFYEGFDASKHSLQSLDHQLKPFASWLAKAKSTSSNSQEGELPNGF